MSDVLRQALAEHGLRAQVHYVPTRPTARLRKRALRLLEVIAETGHVPPHFDWITSGTGFTHEAFEALWGDIARFIAEPGP